jgi:hypothetical protein
MFHYMVVPREGGWAYRLENTFSAVFPTQAEAVEAAKSTAMQMHEHGDDTQVRVFGDDQQWRTEWVHSLDQHPALGLP